MKNKKLFFTILVVIILSSIAYVIFAESDPEIAELKKLDPVQALALANEWKSSRPDVTSFVTSREVVFELDKDRIVKIPLPEDRMVVAVAPYINRTHK